MRLAVLFGLMSVAALFVETSAPRMIASPALIPNLMVILAVDLGLRHRTAAAAALAFAMGYATDAFSGTRLGVNAFLITLVFLLTFQVAKRLLVINALVGAVAVFFGVIVTAVGGVVLGAGYDALEWTLLPGFLLQALLSALISPIVFAILDLLKRGLGLRAGVARE